MVTAESQRHTIHHPLRLPMRSTIVATASLVLLAACSDGSTMGPVLDGDAPTSLAPQGAVGFTVMTRNLYVGADVDAVIAALVSADPTDDQPSLLAAIQ